MANRVAEVGYSKELHRIEVTVPHGTKTAELRNIVSAGFAGLGHRPCTTCISGDHLLVREELADTIQVDLEKG